MHEVNSCNLIIKHYQYIWLPQLRTTSKKHTLFLYLHFTQYCIVYSPGNGNNNLNALDDKIRHSC